MIDKVTIRKTKIEDIPLIMKLLSKTNFLTENALYDTPEYFEKSVNKGVFFVAIAKDKPIGLIHGEYLMCGGAVIWYFVVDEQFRSQGIGKLLLDKFESHCAENNVKWVFGSADINERTVNFYKKNKYGFAGEYIEFTKNL